MSTELSKEILLTILESADVGLYVSDFYTGEILYSNQKFASYVHHPDSDLKGQKCWNFFNYEGVGRCSDCPYQKLVDSEGKPMGKYTREFFITPLNMWVKTINQAIQWVDGRLAQLVTFFDITETKELQDNLTNLAFVDQRLKLKNGLRLEQDMHAAKFMPSLIIFDILSLHKINEAYGREVGDSLLMFVRDWFLKQNIPYSELYRIGGDEFCLTIEHITAESLKALAENLCRRFENPWIFEESGNRPYIFCNASVAIIHGSYIQKNETLLNLIERTLKAARSCGKLTVYNEEMDKEFKRRIQLELSLKRCVQENMDGFEVYYQPIADPITGTWCGLEALCRWNSPELGWISPQSFIPEAERLELIGIIGLWVLETAVRKCKEWRLDKLRKFMLDINLSAVQFLDEMLAPKIIKALYAYDYPGDKLSIEITESTQFTFSDQSLYTIELLRENNVLVALDDFGTGYSSFNNLEGLPVDILKIERVFVTGIETDSYKQYLFHVMSELAHAVDMKLIAEGVETNEQMNILLRNGADLLQGYLFSKPLPPDMMESQLRHFYEIDESFSIIRNRKIDMKELLESENKYMLTPGHYRILNKCMQIMFSNADMDEAVGQVLEIVACYMDISRDYVFLRDEGNIYSEVYEWSAAGITSQKESMQHVSIHKSFLHYMEMDGIIQSTDISIVHEKCSFLVTRETKAIALFPLWEGNSLFGFVGFDDCIYYRDWQPEELLMLHNLCVIILNILIRGRK